MHIPESDYTVKIFKKKKKHAVYYYRTRKEGGPLTACRVKRDTATRT